MSSIASEEAAAARSSADEKTQPTACDSDVINPNHNLPARTSVEEGRYALKEDPATMAASEELRHTSISDKITPSQKEPLPDAAQSDSTDKDIERAVKKQHPEIDPANMQDNDMREQISSPKKKRTRDHDDDTRELEGDSPLDQPGSVANGNAANGNRSTRLGPEKKRPRDASEDKEASKLKVAETSSKDTPQQASTSNKMSNKATTSPQKHTFGGALGDKPQTSSSAFAKSGFASLAASSTSPFGSLGASKPSIFGGGSQPALSGFGALASAKPSTTNTQAQADGTTSSSPQKPAAALTFGGGISSGFGGLGGSTGGVFGSGFGNGFAGGSGPKLSTFAAPGKENVALESKPAKAFGAPNSDNESDASDSEAGTSTDGGGDDDEESGNVGSEDKKKSKATKIQIENGEAGEATLLQIRAKLFWLASKDLGWKERGVGTLKVNVPKSCASFDDNRTPIPGSFDASGLEEEEDPNAPKMARLIMRQENTHRVILNTVIIRAMRFEDKPSTSAAHILFTAFEGGNTPKPVNMLLKMSEANAKLFRAEVKSIQHEL